MYLMSFCERYALNSSNLDHYTTEQSSVAVVCWSRDWPMLWEIPITYGCHSVFPLWKFCRYSCLALQIVSMEEWVLFSYQGAHFEDFYYFHFTKWFPITMVPWYFNYMHANMSYYRCCTNREKANTFLLSLTFPKWADIFTEKKITCSPFCLEDAYASLGFAWYFEHNPHLFIDGLVHDCVFAVEIL